MESIRVTAKTVEDAITEASIKLGTSRDNIDYTIIEKGTSGFFGIGGKKAVIEAKRKFTDEDLLKEVFGDTQEKEKKKEEKREIKKEAVKEKKEVKEVKREEKKDDRKDFKKKEVRKEEKKNPSREQPSSAPAAKSNAAPVKEASGKSEKETPKEAQKEETVKTPAAAAPASAADTEEHSAENTVPKQPRVPANPEEVRRRAETFLKDVFRTMEMDVETKIEFEDDVLSVDLIGEDMGILIGKRGQTLDSLQYLTSLVVNKGKASYVRVKLDTEDYRNRRKATLENLARNIAYKVKKTRRPVFLEPMNPYERRIIHSALQNDPYVTTHSEGDEPCRKVVVTLKKK